MKKLISLFLVLTLALSLVGGAAISAFASDEIDEPAADIVLDAASDEISVESGEDAEEPGEIAEALGEDTEEPGEIVEGLGGDAEEAAPEEGEAAVAEEAAEEALTDELLPDSELDLDGAPPPKPSSDSKYKKASGLVAGQYYIIGSRSDPESPYSVLAANGTNVVVTTLAKLDDATDDMLWQASAASASTLGAKSGGVFLYYLEAANGRTKTIGTFATAAGNANWSYGDGKLVYTAGGQSAGEYAVSIANGAITAEKDGAGTINIYTDGSDLGTSASGKDPGKDSKDPGKDGEGSGKDSSSISYEEQRGGPISGYIGIVVSGYTIGVDRGHVSIEKATITDGKLAITASNFLEATASGDGFTLTLEDPPGETCWLYANAAGLTNTEKDTTTAPDGVWKSFPGGKLGYVVGGTTYYIAGASDSAVSVTTDESAAAQVAIYTGTEKPEKGGPGGGPGKKEVDADAPVVTQQLTPIKYQLKDASFTGDDFVVKAKLPAESTAAAIDFQWYVGGQEAHGPKAKGTVATTADKEETFILPWADSGLNTSATGVTGVYVKLTCTTSATAEDGTVSTKDHTTDSQTVNFIVCEGVAKNTVLTFSDVHEVWDNVGIAVKDTIIATGGFIPSLVIATGDYNNDYVAGPGNQELIDKCISEMIDRIALQLAGIDTVWVSGNHDNGYATGFTNANKDAGLGMVDEDYYDEKAGISGTGIIFDSRSDDYKKNADTSKDIDGLIVIGVNYEDIGSQGAYANPSTGRPSDPSKLDYGTEGSTGTVYEHLQKALDSVAKDYNGELVIISTHAGIHTLGVEPASKASGAKAWSGGNDYSVTNSAAIVKLVNSYVDTYGMDILFLFGHDHSKGEGEFIKVPGDTVISTVSYADRTTEEIVLKFTYAHSGYITDNIGGKERYTLLTWDDETITRTEKVADGSVTDETTKDANILEALTKEIERIHAVISELSEAAAKEAADAIMKSGKLPRDINIEDLTFMDVTAVYTNGDPAPDSAVAKGLTFTLPFPKGAGKNDDFIVFHIHDGRVDKLEGTDLTIEEAGITITVNDLSPFAVAVKPAPVKPAPGAPGAPKTGDETNIVLWIAVLGLCAFGTAAAVLPRKKRN